MFLQSVAPSSITAGTSCLDFGSFSDFSNLPVKPIDKMDVIYENLIFSRPTRYYTMFSPTFRKSLKLFENYKTFSSEKLHYRAKSSKIIKKREHFWKIFEILSLKTQKFLKVTENPQMISFLKLLCQQNLLLSAPRFPQWQWKHLTRGSVIIFCMKGFSE